LIKSRSLTRCWLGLMVSLRVELAATRAGLEWIAELEARLKQMPRNASKLSSSEWLRAMLTGVI
jgi:hypothetical protein